MCFMCVASNSVKCLRMWSTCVCMDRLYTQWPITHLFSIGEIGWTGSKSCNSLILLGAVNSMNKNSLFAFMGFIWRVTILRPRHWSSQRVKWREGRRTDTQTLPPPSLSPPISLTSWTSPPLSLALPHFLPHRSLCHDLLGTVYHDYRDFFLGIRRFALGVFSSFSSVCFAITRFVVE